MEDGARITHVLFDMVGRCNSTLAPEIVHPDDATPAGQHSRLCKQLGPPSTPPQRQDGLLLDTETHYTTAQQKVLEPLGVEFTFELKTMMMGKRAIEAAQALIDATGLHDRITPLEFVERREAVLDALFPTSELMPGADKLVRHLHARGVHMAVATSSHRRHFDAKTQRHGDFFALFSHVVTGDAVERGKPHPDIFQKAAGLFSAPPVDPGAVLVFEDAPAGVTAAKAAGMRCVLVPDARLPEEQRREACEVLGSLEEFDPSRWGLPGYPN